MLLSIQHGHDKEADRDELEQHGLCQVLGDRRLAGARL